MASYRALRSVRHDAHGAVQAKYKYKNKKVQYYITAGDTNPHSPDQKHQTLNSMLLTARQRHFQIEISLVLVICFFREGRAALVTSFGVFKYMAVYSMIQFSTVIILNSVSNYSSSY